MGGRKLTSERSEGNRAGRRNIRRPDVSAVTGPSGTIALLDLLSGADMRLLHSMTPIVTAILCAVLACLPPLPAGAADPVSTNLALSLLGEPKYPPDFKH